LADVNSEGTGNRKISCVINCVPLLIHTTANSQISQNKINKLKTLPVSFPKKIAPCFELRRRIIERDALKYNFAR
jgi:hypothetical protein